LFGANRRSLNFIKRLFDPTHPLPASHPRD
jgi:hypothetical protein